MAGLKVKHNNVLGYFVEISAAHAERIMEDGKEAATEQYGLIHRQTMANAVRFTTVELSELDDKISRAGERALAIELELFEILVRRVLARLTIAGDTATCAGRTRCGSGLAELAVGARYTRPRLTDTPGIPDDRGPAPGGRGGADDGRGPSSPMIVTVGREAGRGAPLARDRPEHGG